MSDKVINLSMAGQQKLNPIQKIIYELKQLIFIILFILLKDQEDIDNMLIYAFFTIADFL